MTSGLKPGDRLIVDGVQLAKPGGKVQPEEYRPALAVAKSTRQVVEPAAPSGAK